MNTASKPMYEWTDLPWKRIQRQVFKLQTRIFKASRRGDVKTVHRLQRLLINSWSAKCLAVRRVTQENKGKKTAGIDGLSSLKPKERLKLIPNLRLGNRVSPTRRVYIPKPGNPVEKRPLNIPTIFDRALQALVKQALEPEWEAKLDRNNYGYRPGRSCRDAIGAIFLEIKQKPKYVLDADIQKCFENINHEALLRKIHTFPKLAQQIRAWLKCGMMEGQTVFPTQAGVPQGGPLSTVLANAALHGMTSILEQSFKGYQRPTLIQYADDIIVVHKELSVIQASQNILNTWLQEIGLKLKPEKTRITHTLKPFENTVGFEFLGFNIRQYHTGKTHSKQGFKTIIQPSKTAQARHLGRLKEIVKNHKSASQAELISHLNPVLRGWSNYYSAVCSKATFTRIDNQLYQKLRAWAYRRHPNKNRQWIVQKYWHIQRGKGWVFQSKTEQSSTVLYKHSKTPIKRHIKVQGKRSPYDGDWVYWGQRMKTFPTLKPTIGKLLTVQKGKCNHCGLFFQSNDSMEIHHVDGNHANYHFRNLRLLHLHCHHQTHRGLHDKHQTIEEPCEATSFMHGFAAESGERSLGLG